MKMQIRFLLYVIFISGTFLLAKGFQGADRVWAGSDHQTIPTATTVPPTETVTSTSTAATATSTTTATATETTTPTGTETITITPSASTSVTSTATATPTEPEGTDSASTRRTAGTIIALVIGGLVLLVGGIGFLLYLLRASRRRIREDDNLSV